MKVCEFFAELGFKVTGADELKAFETSLQNIAQAARDFRLGHRNRRPRKARRDRAAAADVALGQRLKRRVGQYRHRLRNAATAR